MKPDPSIRLGRNSYGKSLVRVAKVFQSGDRHEIRELSVDISLSGDFAAVHDGDNAKCLPTDTMKNTVYALAKDHAMASLESFAGHLADHFVMSHAAASSAHVSISEVLWNREGGRPHTFVHGGAERACADVLVQRGKPAVLGGGLKDLVMLNTTDSAFSGFPRDKYTTLKETRDRIMCTSVTAGWVYREQGGRGPDYAAVRAAIRAALIGAFAGHKSESVQHTLHAMGRAALAAAPAIENIRLSLPNRHYLLVDLSPFGLTNTNEVFVPTDEPHGLIEATVERAG